MKKIFCYGDSNTWGRIPRLNLEDRRRFEFNIRWTGVLDSEIGDNYEVIEEGLGNRTTVFDDPIEGADKNGLFNLHSLMEAHAPLDLVILFLGTNDLKKRFSATPLDIANGIGVLIETIQESQVGPEHSAPKILVLCPPPLGKLTFFSEIFEGGGPKSQELSRYYEMVAAKHKCHFIDTSILIRTSEVDGVHLDATEHKKLGKFLAKTIKDLLED